MTIEQQLTERLKEAMRNKDSRTADVVRMVKTKVMERRTAKGFSGQVDDALHLDVIAAYVKLLKKAIEEFQAAGDRGADAIEQLRFEIAFCEQFLPKMAGEEETLALVRDAIARSGASDPKQAGKVMGEVMKTHKGKVDAALVKQLAERELAPKS